MSLHRRSQAHESLEHPGPDPLVLVEPVEDPTTPQQATRPPLPSISITSTSGRIVDARQGSGSDTETEPTNMSPRPSKHKPSSGEKKQHRAATPPKTKSDDWTAVKDAEERRRIQNRIAQRKFRTQRG